MLLYKNKLTNNTGNNGSHICDLNIFTLFNYQLPCEKASCCQLAPTLGAPSFNTTSTFHVWSSFRSDCIWNGQNQTLHMHGEKHHIFKLLYISEYNTSEVRILTCASKKVLHWHTCLHFSVVMSSWRATTFGMGLMGTKSTPGWGWGVDTEGVIRNFVCFFLDFSPCKVSGGCWSLSKLHSGERQGTPLDGSGSMQSAIWACGVSVPCLRVPRQYTESPGTSLGTSTHF